MGNRLFLFGPATTTATWHKNPPPFLGGDKKEVGFYFGLVKQKDFCYNENMRKILVILWVLILGACAHKNPLSDMAFQTTMAPPHVVASWYKITRPGEAVKIYIEGDGNAFDSEGIPTDNPTPKGEFMRCLAANDPSPNVVYLGRPCQYLQTGACSPKDWTTGRFSKVIIDSMDEVIKAFMKKAKTKQIILIGFSGGAQVTGLVAVRHPGWIKKWITISGVLDQKAWSDYHGDKPLVGSLNLKDKQKELKKIDQIHYVGDEDEVVPPELVQRMADLENIRVIKGAGHGTGYEKIYPEIYEVK